MRKEIEHLLDRDEFRNFAIVTTSGARYDITDRWGVALAKDKFHYYFPKSDRVIHVPYSQIATVEETATSSGKK